MNDNYCYTITTAALNDNSGCTCMGITPVMHMLVLLIVVDDVVLTLS